MSKRKINNKRTAQEKLNQRMERAAAKRRLAAEKSGRVTLSIVAEKDADNNFELKGFDADVEDPQQLIALLCLSICRVVTLSKLPSIDWPHWIHYSSGFIGNLLSQGTDSALESLGVDNKMVQGYLAKHAKDMDMETQAAFEAHYKAQAAKKGETDERPKG